MFSFPESKTWDPWGPHQITQTTLTSYSHIFCSIVLDGQNYIAMAGIHIYTNSSLYVYISKTLKITSQTPGTNIEKYIHPIIPPVWLQFC